jgi:hypothetical protein
MAYHFHYKVTLTELFEFVLAARGAEAGAVEGPHPVARAEDELSYLFSMYFQFLSSCARINITDAEPEPFHHHLSQVFYHCRVRHTALVVATLS